MPELLASIYSHRIVGIRNKKKLAGFAITIAMLAICNYGVIQVPDGNLEFPIDNG